MRITTLIQQLATTKNAEAFIKAEDKRGFTVDLLGVIPTHPKLDYFVDKLAEALGVDYRAENQRVGDGDSWYKLVRCPSTNAYVAQTQVTWTRKYGRCDVRRHSRQGTVFTRGALKSWCKRNGVTAIHSDLEKLPVAV